MHTLCALLRRGVVNYSSTNLIRPISGSVILLNMEEKFQKAVEKSKQLSSAPGQEDMLKLYGLFKQSTTGQCNTKQPGALDFVGKAKWKAWNSYGTMSKEDAKKQYIDLVTSLGADLSDDGGKSAAKPASSASGGKYNNLLVERIGKVFKITFNRPSKKNALTPETYREIEAALKESEASDSLLTVFTGSGDFYCSGNDLGNFMVDLSDKNAIKKLAEDSRKLLQDYVGAYIDHPKPIVALVNGPAIGISVTVMGMFDLVYASDKASFHTPFSALGQSPEGCSSLTFPQLMGLSKATEMLLFNKKLTAEEACRRGLVTEVFPSASFESETTARIKALADLPPQSVTLSRKLIRDSQRELLHKINKIECELLAERWQSQECMNAIMAFFSKKSKM